jgi:hypothetical protein
VRGAQKKAREEQVELGLRGLGEAVLIYHWKTCG